MARMVYCIKLGKEAVGLEFPPLPGKLGERIFKCISKEIWQAWLKQQTMLINENRLNMVDPHARQYLLKQTEKFLFGEGSDAVSGYVQPLTANL
ncbi:oxidative damage protection protein [Candidatus Vallotia tarda]|nr:oxidative damage protection protein [Candidatus Vallotia tarda]CAG7605250.1 Probable Fe(2+)-trafficking protein [Candidatus Vallotia tarda]